MSTLLLARTLKFIVKNIQFKNNKLLIIAIFKATIIILPVNYSLI